MLKYKLILFDNNFFVSFKGHIFDALTLMSLTPSQLLRVFHLFFFLVQTFFPSYKFFCYTLTFVIKWMCDTDKPHFPLKRKTHFFWLFFNLFWEVSRLLNVVRSEITFYDEILWSSMTFCRVLWRSMESYAVL